MLDPQIQFQDVDCPTVRCQIKGLVEDIAQLCPSDATIKATFKKVQDRFLATISVCSENVCMNAIDQAQALNDVLEHIQSKMLSQIVDWRSHRFAS